MDISRSAKLFMQFLRRDFYVHRKDFKAGFINYIICFPSVFALGTGYLQSNSLFLNHTPSFGTMLFTGNLMIVVVVMSYKRTFELLFDLSGNRFIDYQICILNPQLVILERIVFATIYSFILSIPFIPVGKLWLWHYLDTSNTSWISLIIIQFFGALCCSSYQLLAALAMKRPTQITSYWGRINNTLISLGGFFIPWFIISSFSPLLGKVVLLNPLIYFTEGLRKAVLGFPQFFSLSLCVGMLFLFSCIFICIAWYLFKKRTDHI